METDKVTVVEKLRKGLSEMWNTKITFDEVNDELFLLEVGMNPKNKVLSQTIQRLLK